MAYLRLHDRRDDGRLEFDEVTPVRVGRDPEFELVVTGPGSDVVSGNHALFAYRDDAWWLEDAGGRNGTFLDDVRVIAGKPVLLVAGAEVRLGQKGPRFVVEAVTRRVVAETLIEPPARPPTVAESAPVDPDATAPMDSLPDVPAPVPPKAVTPKPAPSPPPSRPATPPARPAAPPPPRPAAPDAGGPAPASPPAFSITLRHPKSDQWFSAEGGRLRLGRGRECELRPVAPGDSSVSRVHAEIVLKPDGRVVLADAQSRNGTLLNGTRVEGERPIKIGDRIKLGDQGPELAVEALQAPGMSEPKRARTPTPAPAPAAQAAAEPPRRSFAGKGRTVFFKELIHETEQKNRSRVRVIVWSFVVLLAGAAGGLWWIGEQRVRETEAALEAQRAELAVERLAADSSRRAAALEVERLTTEFQQARAGAAPVAVLDSLRVALQAAEQRTSQLEGALARSQQAINVQLAAGDSLRVAAQQEISRMRQQLSAQERGNASSGALDSIRAAMAAAEQRAVELEAGLRAVRGVDLAQIAERNQAAVGLVTTFADGGAFDGSGFVVTTSGYLVTNRHVARPEGHLPDSVLVTMADQRVPFRADVIAVTDPQGPDLAVLRLRRYTGSAVQRVDWQGNAARQGEPAALIGFPTGIAAALDQSGTVRTSMSGGYFSKVTGEMIQFDGFTVPGSSGSPIFNASGTVVAVHARGLREGPGLAFTVPIRLLVPLLPADARRELGL